MFPHSGHLPWLKSLVVVSHLRRQRVWHRGQVIRILNFEGSEFAKLIATGSVLSPLIMVSQVGRHAARG